MSAAAIHKIERNDMVPTITTLLKIATALERPVSYFVDSDDGLLEPSPSPRRPSGPQVFTPHAGIALAGVSGPYAPFRSAAAVATVEPGANSGTKPLVHAGEELVFVLEGHPDLRPSPGRGTRSAGETRCTSSATNRTIWANESQDPGAALWIALRDS